MSRAELLALYKKRGIITIPVDRKKKAIVNYKDIISQNDPRCVVGVENNVAALTGYRSRMILLDIDVPHDGEYDGREYMRNMFPDLKTASVKSPRGYHMWFSIQDDRIYQISNSTRVFKYDGRVVSIDIRNNGGYGLLPPSSTIDGQYVWETPMSEIIPMPEMMINLLLEKREPSSGRQARFRDEMCVPHVDVDCVGEIIECFEKVADYVKQERAESYDGWVLFMLALVTYMNIPSVSESDFVKLEECAHRFSRRSLTKYKRDETTLKLQKLIDGDSRTTVATPLYWLKKDNPAKFSELYEIRREKWLANTLTIEVKTAEERVKCIEDLVKIANKHGGHLQSFYIQTIPLVIIRIGDPRTYIIVKRNGSRPSFDARTFREKSYGGDTFRVIMPDGKTKDFTLYELANRYATNYESTTFSVDNTHKPCDYNMYPGLNVSYIPKDKRNYAAVDFYNNHLLKVMCSGDQFLYKYLTKWLYEAFRGRGRGIPALVFKGIQGCGKSIFWVDLIMTRIFGDSAAPIRSVKDFTRDFNSIISRKTLLVADETGTGRTKCDRNVMKTALTAVRGIIERKGLEAVVEDLFFAAVFLTNDKNSVPIEENDRRFMCIDIKATVNNKSYFAQFLHHNQNAEACSSWYSDIVDRASQLEDVDAGMVHASEMKVQMMIHSNPILTYIYEVCTGVRDVKHMLIHPGRAMAQTWYSDFKRDYPKAHNSLSDFATEFSKWTSVVTHSRQKFFSVSRETFQQSLRVSTGFDQFIIPEPPEDPQEGIVPLG